MTTDVLVVGAGPTGLTMAGELRRHGLDVRIVDRAPEPARTSRALVVQSRTLEILDDLGVADAAIAEGRLVDGFTGVFSGGRSAHMNLGADLSALPELDTRYPRPLMLSQDRTEALLAANLEGLGVRVERGLGLESYRETGEGVTATLRRADGREEPAEARWIVGCDGAHSAVRRSAGIPFDGVTYEREFIMADARLDWDLPDGELYVFPGEGLFAAWSMPGKRRFRVFGDVPAGEGDPTMADFQRMLDERVPVPAKVIDTAWVSRYRLHRRGVPRYRAGRAFLAGDAAHIHSPVGGQGMNTGIQDAYNLAWKLALGGEELLDTYHAERRPVGEALLRTTDRAFGVVIADSWTARQVRTRFVPNVLPKLLDRPAVQRLAVGLISQLKIKYPGSPLSGQSGRWSGGPEPGSRAWDAPLPGDRRLYDVLRGPHHTVLLFGAAATPSRARRLEERHGPRLIARAVTTDGPADGTPVLPDPGGVLHRRYDASRRPAAYVIRPDGHIAFRTRDPAALESDLTHRLPTP
ncbi:FAD-dependent monooxygenase [Sphaerisporangium sp. TRM90804]|uniref:FAD-dependent monooxygenase n=1 Tax=Sphaerisporangium sp. TRM90804 TaxID=3031113 RepID=UPI002448C581|nr:FAD-dependent monooxygenase [Sphaerisporangium sp. TRM90804]MDH2429565.1 FAD-dependent monooxygenase [Sphaerisporangium sp. TRM90804]